MDLVHATLIRGRPERVEQGGRDLPGILAPRAVREPLPVRGHFTATEPVPNDSLGPRDEHDGFLALAAQQARQRLRLAQHVGVVPAAEAPVAGEQHDRCPRRLGRLGRLGRQRMINRVRPAHHGLHRPGDFPRVWSGRVDPLLCPDDPRGGDQLLSTRDLSGGLDRTNPPPDRAKLCSHPCRRLLLGLLLLASSVYSCSRRGTYRVIFSWSTSSASSASTGSSRTSISPELVWKPFLKSSIASFRAAAVSSENSPVSLMAS